MSCGCGSCSFLEYSPGRSVATDGTELDHEPCDGAGIVNVAPVPPAPAPEAKEGEMTEQGLRIALEPFYRQGVYVGLAEMQGNAELALAHASRSSEALRPVLAAWTALRTRAREAEEREAKWRRELSAACELSERAREIVVSALNQPPEHYYDKHDNGEWSAEHIAFAIRSLFGERDEAREQRDAIRKHSSAEIGRLGLEVARLRDDFVAANARAEEAEELSEGLAHDLGKADGDRMTALVALDTERAARLRAEAERDEAKRVKHETYDREIRLIGLWGIALKRWGVTVPDYDAPVAERMVAAAEAEVKRLREALGKINGIRDSIVGLQAVNFSEHVYPLVAALNDAGFVGMPYPEAKGKFGTMLERTTAAEAEVASIKHWHERELRGIRTDLTTDQLRLVLGKVIKDCHDALHTVREEADALRAHARRLVEAGDEAGDIMRAVVERQYTYQQRTSAIDRWLARWAATKADAREARP